MDAKAADDRNAPGPARAPATEAARAREAPTQPALNKAYLRSLGYAVIVGFLVVIGIAALIAYFVVRLNDTQEYVARTLIIQGDARLVLSTIDSLESSHRGYLLTGDQRFLENYQRLSAVYDKTVAKLGEQVAGRPDQINRLSRIKDIAARKFVRLDQALGAFQAGRIDEARRLVSDGEGEEMMAQIRALFVDFHAASQKRVTDASAELANLGRWLLSTAVLALLGLVGLAIAMVGITRRQFQSLEASGRALAGLNETLEERVEERTRDLEAARAAAESAAKEAEHEKARAEALLRDVNHRVGNNLALVSSFLGLQMRTISDERSRRALEAARARVHTIATTQRKLRLGSDTEMTRVDGLLREVIEDVTSTMPDAYRIKLEWDIAPIRVQSRDAVSVGVIACELVLNAGKYAFPAQETGTIRISVQCVEEGAEVVIADDGVGRREDEDKTDGGGLGTQIIYLLSSQFGGEPIYGPARDDPYRPGLLVRVPMPKLKVDLE